MRRPRAWIVAGAGLLGAAAIGLFAASLVFPSDQPKPAASPGEIAIKIDPAPSPLPTPVTATPPVQLSPPAATVLPRRFKPRPKPTPSAPDPDPITVTTINSW